MKNTLFAVITSDWNTCLWFSNTFNWAFGKLYWYLKENDSEAYIDMYQLPNPNIEWCVAGWEFQLQYCWQTIFSDDYESMNIIYHCIVSWSCIDDIKSLQSISEYCDLSLKF